MALKDRKITEAGIAQHGVISAPDRLTGTAAENKKVFDKLVRNVVAEQLNGLIDELAGSGGASEIGANSIDGLDGDNVQQILAAMKADMDERIKEAGVASFNGRSGLVIPQSGDYTAAMVGAAPAGFGFGVPNLIVVDDLHSLYGKGSGFYKCIKANIPDTGGWWGAFYFDSHIMAFRDSYIAHKFYKNGTWSEWEWVTPPMRDGVEYRTTERYMGKPVYVQLVDFGVLPNATIKEVAFTAEPISIVRCSGKTNGGATIPWDGIAENGDWSTLCIINNNKIRIYTGGDFSGYTAQILVHYTKTKD